MKNLVFLVFIVWLGLAISEYKVAKITKNSTSIVLALEYTGKDSYYIKPTSPIIKNLIFLFHVHTDSNFIIKITDADRPRFEVPQGGAFPKDPYASSSFPIEVSQVAFQYTVNPFDFKVTRRNGGSILFSTYNRTFIYSEHYLQIGTEVESPYLYGIGERFAQNFKVKDGKWTMFTREQGFTIDKGDGRNAYGYYPFYMIRQKNKLYHLNYFRSSNAMDLIKETEGDRHFIVYKVIGGIFDFRFFVSGEKPFSAIANLHDYIGSGPIPPFWSFGFHQSRWGYQNISYLTDVIQNYNKYKIPLDTIWTDIDYMLQLQDFTIDEERFPLDQMKELMKQYKWVPIIDAGIKTSGPTYEEGLKRGVFTLDPNGKPFVGKVWPGDTVFVDFFHPNATQYWADMLDVLYKKLPFDGLWLDMNQINNFCNGPCHVPTDPSVFDYSKDLPYNPGFDNIETNTIPLNCTHYGKKTEANVHVYHGHLTTYASYTFLKKKKERPFLITRSSTLGTRKYGFHWTGDTFSDWSFLKESIPHILNNQLFGFQMVGADICGFGGDATVELCARWYQLGAMYPFARSHNILGTVSQEPYAMGPIVLEASTRAIKLRYSLLKYLFSLFVMGRGSGFIWRPLSFNNYQDENCFSDKVESTQFLIGESLMVAPILEEGQTSRQVYFPDNYHDFYTGKLYSPGFTTIKGYELTGNIPLFINQKGGLLVQNVTSVTSTKDLNNEFTLKAALFYDQTNYVAAFTTLSIVDFSHQRSVAQCIDNYCTYSFTLIFNPMQRLLTIRVSAYAEYYLQERLVITDLELFVGEEVIKMNLATPIEIEDNFEIKIRIPKSEQSGEASSLLTE